MTKDFAKVKSLHDEGIEELKKYNIKRAIVLLEKARKLAPNNASIRNNLGTAYTFEQQYKKAEQSFYQATKIDSFNPEYSFNLANCLVVQKNFTAAIGPLEQTLNNKFDHFQARCLQIRVLLELNELDNLLAHASELFNIFPENSTSIHLLALSLIRLDKYNAALELLLDSIKTFQTSFELFQDLGIVYSRLHDYSNAKKYLEKSLLLNPNDPNTINNLGKIFLDSFDFEQARAMFQKAIQIQPEFANPYIGLAKLDLYKRNPDGAFKMLDAAIFHNAQNLDARFEKSTLLMATGNYVEGTDLYESRFGTTAFASSRQDYDLPLYDGRKLLTNQILFVWEEQGIGDQIFFAKFLKPLCKNVKNVVLACDPRLVPVFTRSFPEIKVIANDSSETIIADYQIPMGSLPRLFKYNIADLYQLERLIKTTENSQRIRDEYKEKFGNQKLVGVAWHTNNSNTGHLRSIPLDKWGQILSAQDCQFISLQYSKSPDDNRIYQDLNINQMKNLEDFVDQIAACDFIITIDNSTAFIAASLMKPTWCMVPILCDWRYGISGNKTFWYNTMRIYRQSNPGMWEDVILNIAVDLQDSANNSGL